ncbi:MAG: metallophosphoesterase [Clostridia bacterium]|nr:metallophosphoesterase [Clostridia bacterium]
MYNNKLKFNSDGKFIILQVSDAQDMHIPRKGMFKMLNKVYDKVNPDLIVLTGDNILGNHINDAPIGNRQNVKTKKGTLKRMKKALGFLLDPIEKRGIPFAFHYGNHDDRNMISKKEQAEIYGSYDHCIPYENDDETVDYVNYNVPIYDSKGEKMKYNIWMIDSAGDGENGVGSHEWVKPETLDWYVRKSRELQLENGSPVMSLMFQHIPVLETVDFFMECDKDDKGAVLNRADNKYYKLNPEKATGFAFEYPATVEKDFGQLDMLRKRGDVCALVFGHDHLNSFTGELDGVNIVQSPGASFRSYGNMISRGVRVFEIDENDTSSFRTYTISYFDLFGKKFPSVLRYIFNADEYEKIKALIIGLFAVIGVGLIAYLVSILNLYNKFLF